MGDGVLGGVGVDGGNIVKVIEGVEEFLEFFGVFAGDGDLGGGEIFELGVGDGEASIQQGLADFHEVASSSEDDEAVLEFVDILSASLESGHHGVLAGIAQLNPALALELEHDRAWVGHAATVLGKGVADFGHGAVFVVGGDFDNDADTAWAVAFVNFFDQRGGGFVGDAGDGAFDVDFGHVGLTSLLQHHGKGRVHVGISTAASGDGDLVGDLGEKGATLGVNHGFLAFGSRPFTVS